MVISQRIQNFEVSGKVLFCHPFNQKGLNSFQGLVNL